MLNWTRIFTILATVGFLMGIQACAQKLDPQEDCNFVVNSQKQRVSWAGRLPVILYIDRSVPSEFYSSIQNAVNDWNRQMGKEVLRVGGVTAQNSAPATDGSNVIYWSTNWEPNRTFEQARTTVRWIGDSLNDTDVIVNARDFRYSAANQPIRGFVDFESLMVHEFGHVLGLAHVENSESVMVKSLPSDHLRRQPSDFDIRSTQCEY